MIVAVKKPHVNKVAPAESIAMPKSEIKAEGREQGFTILGTNFATCSNSTMSWPIYQQVSVMTLLTDCSALPCPEV